MKSLLAVVTLLTLGGCAVAPQGYYAAQQQPYDPYQWHTVPSGTVQSGQNTSSTYATQPVYSSQPVYVQQPVYVAQPYYAPAPAYYYPPISIGLDFGFSRWSGGGYRGRGWGGGFHGRSWR